MIKATKNINFITLLLLGVMSILSINLVSAAESEVETIGSVTDKVDRYMKGIRATGHTEAEIRYYHLARHITGTVDNKTTLLVDLSKYDVTDSILEEIGRHLFERNYRVTITKEFYSEWTRAAGYNLYLTVKFR